VFPSGIDRESSVMDIIVNLVVWFIIFTHNGTQNGVVILMFRDCDIEKIVPIPNRFVWINPVVPHKIEVVNNIAETNRITIVSCQRDALDQTLQLRQ
jgi:hypothetical protein